MSSSTSAGSMEIGATSTIDQLLAEGAGFSDRQAFDSIAAAVNAAKRPVLQDSSNGENTNKKTPVLKSTTSISSQASLAQKI